MLSDVHHGAVWGVYERQGAVHAVSKKRNDSSEQGGEEKSILSS